MILDCDQCGSTIFGVPDETKRLQCGKCNSVITVSWKTKREQLPNKLMDDKGVRYAE